MINTTATGPGIDSLIKIFEWEETCWEDATAVWNVPRPLMEEHVVSPPVDDEGPPPVTPPTIPSIAFPLSPPLLQSDHHELDTSYLSVPNTVDHEAVLLNYNAQPPAQTTPGSRLASQLLVL
eukprot:TRINITY_DN86591_c0_g1_i1.p1 TRINITY_DN86591_c0_g1~~TRINITY_DN86591_c0_g1_i1.p1  ORF type:complete len:131 (-),score=15.95 TRINITY_DN86591_c0_g1_i1:8-373(-)